MPHRSKKSEAAKRRCAEGGPIAVDLGSTAEFALTRKKQVAEFALTRDKEVAEFALPRIKQVAEVVLTRKKQVASKLPVTLPVTCQYSLPVNSVDSAKLVKTTKTNNPIQPNPPSSTVTYMTERNATNDCLIQPVDRSVLMGSFHQGHSQFGKERNNQCGAISLTAVLKSKVSDVWTWLSRDLDDVLIKGTVLYRSMRAQGKIRDQGRGYIAVSELPRHYKVWNCNFAINYAESYSGLISIDDYDQSLRDLAMPLDEALQRSLYCNDACLLTICANTYAIVNGGGKFAFVDSHTNESVNRKGERVSCVAYFNSVETLCRHVYDFAQSFGVSTPRFEVTGVKAAISHVDPDDANRSPMVSSHLYSDIVKGKPTHKVCGQQPGVSEAGNFGKDTGSSSKGNAQSLYSDVLKRGPSYCSDQGKRRQRVKTETKSQVNDVIDVDANTAAQSLDSEVLKRGPSYCSDQGKRRQRLKTEIKSQVNNVIDVDANTAARPLDSEGLKRGPSYCSDQGKRRQRVKTEIKSQVNDDIDVDANTAARTLDSEVLKRGPSYCSDQGKRRQRVKTEIKSQVNDVIDVDANTAARPLDSEGLKRGPSSDQGKRRQFVKRVKTEIKSHMNDVIDVDADMAKESFQSQCGLVAIDDVIISEVTVAKRTFKPLTCEDQDVLCKKIGLSTVHFDERPKTMSSVDDMGCPCKIQSIKPDGNCFYRSLAWSICRDEDQHLKVRRAVVKHLQKNSNVFESYLRDEYRSVPDYVTKSRVYYSGSWAKEIDIFAAADLLQTAIVTFNDGRWNVHAPIAGPQSDNCIYLNHTGNHYEVVTCVQHRNAASVCAGTCQPTNNDGNFRSLRKRKSEAEPENVKTKKERQRYHSDSNYRKRHVEKSKARYKTNDRFQTLVRTLVLLCGLTPKLNIRPTADFKLLCGLTPKLNIRPTADFKLLCGLTPKLNIRPTADFKLLCGLTPKLNIRPTADFKLLCGLTPKLNIRPTADFKLLCGLTPKLNIRPTADFKLLCGLTPKLNINSCAKLLQRNIRPTARFKLLCANIPKPNICQTRTSRLMFVDTVK